MKTNICHVETVRTHEGGRAIREAPIDQLRRSLLTCLLWEDNFYEDGMAIAERIMTLVGKVDASSASKLALQARHEQKLRHAPLLMCVAMCRYFDGRVVGDTISSTISRADEMGELLSLYRAANPDKMIPRQMRLGIGRAFSKFDEYQLSKWDSRKAQFSLYDVMHLCRPVAGEDRERGLLYAKIANRTNIPAAVRERYNLSEDESVGLATPNTWEARLSAGEDKRKVFTDLIGSGKLGAMALLRNLRNMQEAGVPIPMIRKALNDANPSRVLPFRFLTAASAAREFAPELQGLMFKCLASMDMLPGRTSVLVDISASMKMGNAGNSKLERVDAAAGLAILLREVCASSALYVFNTSVGTIKPTVRGFELHDVINAAVRGGTRIGNAVSAIPNVYDRLIVLTDEQSRDRVPNPIDGAKGYMINVASHTNGVGSKEGWKHITGWSEHVIRYIQALEAHEADRSTEAS